MRRFTYGLMALAFALLSVGVARATTKADIDAFLKSTTYLVLHKNQMSEWNFKMPDAVRQSWTLTPFQVINYQQFEQMRHDPDKSFIIRMKFKFPEDKIKAPYKFMVIVRGAKTDDLNAMPELASMPLGYASSDQDSWAYKLEGLLRFAQHHILYLQQHPDQIGKNPLLIYNKNLPSLKGKELWLVKSDLTAKVNSVSKIRKYYDGRVRIVAKEDIRKAIKAKRKDVVYLHKVGPEGHLTKARVYKALLGAGDDRMYYFDYHNYSKKKGDGLLKKDFKRLNKR